MKYEQCGNDDSPGKKENIKKRKGEEIKRSGERDEKRKRCKEVKGKRR